MQNLNKDTCLVLDLDDTLYKELDYQTSGFSYIERKVNELFGKNINGELQRLKDLGCKDIFLELTRLLSLPESVKASFLSMYRFHEPKIVLSKENQEFVRYAKNNFAKVVILSDGRSISQRLKVYSLNITDFPLYISEEWESKKPDDLRFRKIMQKYSCCKTFCYVGDNPKKDFIAPNKLSWTTICLSSDEKNIHSQDLKSLSSDYYPNFWINSLIELKNVKF